MKIKTKTIKVIWHSSPLLVVAFLIIASLTSNNPEKIELIKRVPKELLFEFYIIFLIAIIMMGLLCFCFGFLMCKKYGE